MENSGHGHVNPRPDGIKARCGGPVFCTACRAEKLAGLGPFEKLKILYESEINWELSCFYDGGYIVRLGDVANGFAQIEEGFHESIEKAVDYLWEKAKETYPKAACFDRETLV